MTRILLLIIVLSGCLVACSPREPILSLITLDMFFEDVPKERLRAVGMIAELEQSENQYWLSSEKYQLLLDIEKNECISNLIDQVVFIRFSPRESFRSEPDRLESYIYLHLSDGGNPRDTMCVGEITDPSNR